MEKRLEELEICGRSKTIQITALLRLAKILRSLEDLKKLAVTQTPVKDQQFILVGKTCKKCNNNNNNNNYNNRGRVEIIQTTTNYGQNTKKSPGDLKRLAGTQTPVEGHQLMLV